MQVQTLRPRRRRDGLKRGGGIPQTAVVQAISAVLGALALVAAGRSLGPAGQGVLAVALTVPATLTLLLGLGQDVATSYLAASGRASVSHLADTALLISLAGGVAGSAVVGLLLFTGADGAVLPGVGGTLLVMGMGLAALNLADAALAGLLRGVGALGTANRLDLLQAAVTGTLVVALLHVLRPSAEVAYAAYLLGTGVSAAGRVVAIAERTGRMPRPLLHRRVLKAAVSFGARACAGNLVQFVSYRLDVYILDVAAGAAAVGRYSVAVRFAEALWLLPHAIGLVHLPRSSAQADDTLRQRTPGLFWGALAACVAGGACLVVVGGPLVRVLFADHFGGTYPLLLLLLPGVILLGPASVLAAEISGRGHPGRNLAVAAATATVAVGLDLTLIPLVGAPGAAVASSCSYAVSAVLTVAIYLHLARVTVHDFVKAMRGLKGRWRSTGLQDTCVLTQTERHSR